jgi:hypothetical protein
MDLRPLLVDTNVIIEGHRTQCWTALTSRYEVQTVEKCLEETLTGYQKRRPEEVIDQIALRQSLRAVHAVTEEHIAAAVTREPLIGQIDPGEKHLWSHALSRDDVWILCGPDGSNVRVAVNLGLGDRLVALEPLLAAIGHRPKIPLKSHHRAEWLDSKRSQFGLSRPGRLS